MFYRRYYVNVLKLLVLDRRLTSLHFHRDKVSSELKELDI